LRISPWGRLILTAQLFHPAQAFDQMLQQSVEVTLAKKLANQHLIPQQTVGSRINTLCLTQRLTAAAQPETARSSSILGPWAYGDDGEAPPLRREESR